MILLELFWSFFQIGLFSIGGGYAALPIIQYQIVDLNNWLTIAEFSDIVAISQMTPGPIAINAATFVGLQIAGLWGAIVATLGCVLPSFIIMIILALVYYKYRSLTMMQGILGGMRPAVVAMIASAGLAFLVLAFWNGQPVSFDFVSIDFVAIVIFILSLLVLRIKKSNPVFVMIGAGIVGLITYSIIG